MLLLVEQDPRTGDVPDPPGQAQVVGVGVGDRHHRDVLDPAGPAPPAPRSGCARSRRRPSPVSTRPRDPSASLEDVDVDRRAARGWGWHHAHQGEPGTPVDETAWSIVMTDAAEAALVEHTSPTAPPRRPAVSTWPTTTRWSPVTISASTAQSRWATLPRTQGIPRWPSLPVHRRELVRPFAEKAAQMSCWSVASTLRLKRSVGAIRGQLSEVRATQTETRAGSRETETKVPHRQPDRVDPVHARDHGHGWWAPGTSARGSPRRSMRLRRLQHLGQASSCAAGGGSGAGPFREQAERAVRHLGRHLGPERPEDDVVEADRLQRVHLPGDVVGVADQEDVVPQVVERGALPGQPASTPSRRSRSPGRTP